MSRKGEGAWPVTLELRALLSVTASPEFQSIYERLGVRVTERGESFYQPLMPQVVADLEARSERPHYWLTGLVTMPRPPPRPGDLGGWPQAHLCPWAEGAPHHCQV